MLSDLKLRNLKPRSKPYKVADRDGLYVIVSPAGGVTFRFDYRLSDRRETLTLGRYNVIAAREVSRELSELQYGMRLSLAEARLLLTRARRAVELGQSPAREKAESKHREREAMTFGEWTEKFLAEAPLADSTKAMRLAIYTRDVEKAFGRRRPEEITPKALLALCERIKKERDAPATAAHVREIVMQVFRFMQARGIEIDNPADKIRASAVATFKPRERSLSPDEIRVFFTALDGVGTLPHIRLGIKFILLTLLRKGELLNAQWPWIDFEAATLTVPAEYMKARKPHVVYLSTQALDILFALKAIAGSSPYLLPGRYETDQRMSDATLNRVILAAVKAAQAVGKEIEPFTVHDLRRTGSTLLHEAGYNTDWIEKALAHEQRGVRAVYNKAGYAEQRRKMLQEWADLIDGWRHKAEVLPLKRAKRQHEPRRLIVIDSG
jgi:integrase